jgi:hypothetical protein
MSRIRTVKPQLFTHEHLFDAEQQTGLPLRLAFIGLLCQCDREGRFRWQPRTLKADVLPFDDVDFSRVLDALSTHGFILRYECDGDEFGVIPTFRKHQAINNRESPSEIPPPPEASTDGALTRAARVHDASGACISGRGIRKGKGNKERERKKNPARGARADDAPRFDARAHLLSLGVDESLADDWLTLRKRKQAATTRTAIAGIEREATKAGITFAEALRICCERNWAGFAASWLERERLSTHGPPRSNAMRDGSGLWALGHSELNALARELGIGEARIGETAQAFIARILAARNGRDRLH